MWSPLLWGDHMGTHEGTRVSTLYCEFPAQHPLKCSCEHLKLRVLTQEPLEVLASQPFLQGTYCHPQIEVQLNTLISSPRVAKVWEPLKVEYRTFFSVCVAPTRKGITQYFIF